MEKITIKKLQSETNKKHSLKNKKIKTILITTLLTIIIFNTSTNTTAADNTNISIYPTNQTVNTNQTFNIEINCIPDEAIKSFEFKISYNPSIIQINKVEEGTIFNNYNTFFNSGTIDNTQGILSDVYNFIIGAGSVNTPGTFAIINISAKNIDGQAQIDLYDVGVTDESGYITVNVNNAIITVEGSNNPPPPPPPPPSQNVTEDENETSTGGNSGSPGGEVNNNGFFKNEEQTQQPTVNRPPQTPTRPSGPTNIESNINYGFTISTFDIDNDKIRYKFDWGDGDISNWSNYTESNTTITMTNYWNKTQTYEISVIAQDEKGSNSSWSQPLNITVSQTNTGNIPPTADINYKLDKKNIFLIQLDASESFDPDGNITQYYWDYGDNTTGKGINTTHKYEKPGEYTITLVTTDENNNTYSKSIVVPIGFGNQDNQAIATINTTFFQYGYILIIFEILILIGIIYYLKKDLKKLIKKTNKNKKPDIKIKNKKTKFQTDYIRAIRYIDQISNDIKETYYESYKIDKIRNIIDDMKLEYEKTYINNTTTQKNDLIEEIDKLNTANK